jgi:hypothetical protein
MPQSDASSIHSESMIELLREPATVTARVLGKPQFLAQYPRTAALMLRRMDRDNRRHLTRIQQLLPGPHFEETPSSSPDDPIALCCRQASFAATRPMP